MRSILLAIPLMLYAWSASSECSTWSILVNQLAGYGQIQTAQSLTDGSNVLAIFENPTDGQWTIVRMTPQRCATIWARGIGWRWLFRRRSSE